MTVLIVGIGTGIAASSLIGRPSPAPVDPSPAVPAGEGDPDAAAELPEPGAPIAADQATTAEQAVSGFLTAEARGEWEASWTFLAEADRDQYGSVAAWVQGHGDLPVVTAFRVEGEAPEGDAVRVTTLTGYEPGLDPILGLIPARSRTAWLALPQDGLWRVAFAERTDQPLYPSPDPAPGVARRWAEQRSACEPGGELEVAPANLVTLAERLCGADGELRLGEVSTLGQTADVTQLISAYGPEVFEWARAVPIESPERLQVVLAPIGTDWRVIGVIPLIG